MSRLTRDVTAGPISRDKILRRERGQENIHFPVQLTTNRVGNLTRLILVVVVVVVSTLKTVLTSIKYLLFLTLQGKETISVVTS